MSRERTAERSIQARGLVRWTHLKEQFTPKLNIYQKCPQAIENVDELVYSSDLEKLSITVNGCRQSDKNITIIHQLITSGEDKRLNKWKYETFVVWSKSGEKSSPLN